MEWGQESVEKHPDHQEQHLSVASLLPQRPVVQMWCIGLVCKICFCLARLEGGAGSTSYCLLPYNPFQKRMSFQFGRRKKNKRMKTFVELQTAATKEPEAEVEDEEDDEDGGDMSKYKLDSDEVRAFFFPPVPLSMLVSKPFFSHSLSLHFHIQPHSRFILHWSKREGIRSLIGYHLKEILHGCESMQWRSVMAILLQHMQDTYHNYWP